MDFWKAFLLAEIVIYAIYMAIGIVVYSHQGQYTYSPAYEGETEVNSNTLGQSDADAM